MNVPRFWTRESVESADAKGRVHRGTAWGWSAATLEEARQRARASAQRVVEWLTDLESENVPPTSGQYMYGLDRPPREEIIQEFHDAAGDTTAVITRNSYGSLVLNARDLMFIDIDLPPVRPSLGKLFGSLFGKKKIAAPDPDDAIRDRVRAWSAAHRDYGLRVYRTAAGYRVVIIDRPLAAASDESRAILEDLGSDPLYRRLCDAQKCFRARLSPKPWRMRRKLPPARFPFCDAATEAKYRAWQRTYDEAAVGFATCRLGDELGPRAIHSDLAPLVELHDTLSGCGRNATLA